MVCDLLACHTRQFCSCHKRTPYEVQAGIETFEPSSAFQNVKFEDEPNELSDGVSSYVDPTRSTQDSSDATLGQFLSRPVLIYTHKWNVGSHIGIRIDPWTLFFEDKRVGNRISNFNLLRCTLKVKVVINGNPFLFGKAMMSYSPLWVWDNLSHDSFSERDVMLMQQSQRPKLFMDPCTSTGGTLTLPFFFFKNYLNVADGDWTQMGSLYLTSLQPLKHANSTLGSCNLQVFAWAEDVSLSVPTHKNAFDMTPQSGKEIDEANKLGTISGPATTVANMAAMAATVPSIAPFAMATSKTAEGVASLAKLFGMSRPPMTAEPHHMRPTSVGSLALTTTPVRTEKLSTDDKQEITIDPRISGIDHSEDPMAIKIIAQKETYLTQFTWQVSDPIDTLLWNGRVTPLHKIAGPATGTNSACLPAVTAATVPFTYWTGCIKYRFQFACSAYHRGRVLVVYDPNALQANPEFNVNYCEIVDISAKNDFSVTIHNSQATPVLRTHSEDFASKAFNSFSTTLMNTFEAGTNGVIGIYVLNSLTSPNEDLNNDIQVNVYVSAGDDYETFVPNEAVKDFVFFPQFGIEYEAHSGVEPGTTMLPKPTAESNETEQNAVTNIGICDTIVPDLNKVYFGESIKSFRTLLKRYNFHSILSYSNEGNTANLYSHYGERNLYPYFRGNAPNGVDSTTMPLYANYNLCNTILFHWVTAGFQGFRGGMRYKLVPFGPFNDLSIYAARDLNGIYRNQTRNMPTNFPVLDARARFSNEAGAPDGWLTMGSEGAAFASGHVNPTLDIEIPFYSQWRFVGGKPNDYVSVDGQWSEGWCYESIGTRSPSNDAYLGAFCAVADDFQCYLWTGLPVVWENTAVLV